MNVDENEEDNLDDSEERRQVQARKHYQCSD